MPHAEVGEKRGPARKQRANRAFTFVLSHGYTHACAWSASGMTFDQGPAFSIVIDAMALFVWGRLRYDIVA